MEGKGYIAVPMELMKNLSPSELSVWLFLKGRCNKGSAVVKDEELSKELNMSSLSVKKAINSLVGKGYLVVSGKLGEDTVYKVLVRINDK